jgi:hypothetical protein
MSSRLDGLHDIEYDGRKRPTLLRHEPSSPINGDQIALIAESPSENWS